MFKFKIKGKYTDGIRGYLIGIGICIAILIACSLVMAIFLTSISNSSAKINLYSLIALIIAAILSGTTLSRLKGDGGVVHAFSTSLSTAFLMLIIGLIISNGELSGGSFMNYGCYIGVSTLTGYLGRKKERRHRRKRHAR